MEEKVTYPQYRKYAHERTYFKIISNDTWEELHVMGNTVTVHSFKASILPDRNYIYDLTYDYQNNWLKIEAEEYETVKAKSPVRN